MLPPMGEPSNYGATSMRGISPPPPPALRHCCWSCDVACGNEPATFPAPASSKSRRSVRPPNVHRVLFDLRGGRHPVTVCLDDLERPAVHVHRMHKVVVTPSYSAVSTNQTNRIASIHARGPKNGRDTSVMVSPHRPCAGPGLRRCARLSPPRPPARCPQPLWRIPRRPCAGSWQPLPRRGRRHPRRRPQDRQELLRPRTRHRRRLRPADLGKVSGRRARPSPASRRRGSARGRRPAR